MKTCAFTGHRPNGFSFGYNEFSLDCINLKHAIHNAIRELHEKGIKYFITGCAMGVDMWAAEEVMELKKEFDDIKLLAAVPFEGMEERWSDSFKERYRNIISNCDRVKYICNGYTKNCYLVRDRFMVDHADMILAVYDRKKRNSGTGYTVNYAMETEKPVVIVDPETLEVC